MKKEMYIPMFGLMAGELMIFYGNVFYGLGIHMANLLVTTLMVVFESSLELKMKNILRYIILISLLRMINISIPQLFTVIIIQYLLMWGVMLIPIYYTIKDKLVLYKESRINPIKFYISLVIVLLIGFTVLAFQHEMLNPIPSEVIYIGGEFVTIYLIISIIITLVSSDTKYWNSYGSDTLDMSSNSLLPVFVLIVIQKMVM